jgi:hypothetical protein
MPNPNDPKADPRRDEETRRPEHRTDQSRKGQGPDNPLPGEPGGPSTSGQPAAEEGQRKAPPADKDSKR